jgi:hypothetical protein
MGIHYSQASNHGGASICNTPATILDALGSNLQNIKHKHADQPAKKRVTPNLFHVSPLLNLRGGKQTILKNVCIGKIFCGMLQGASLNLKC